MCKGVVYAILTLMAVQKAKRLHIASWRWVSTRAGCLIGAGLPNAQLARNSG
jgi:hypothetical protein